MTFSQIADCTALYNRLHPASLEKPQGPLARGAATASLPSPLPCGLSSAVSEPASPSRLHDVTRTDGESLVVASGIALASVGGRS